MVEMCESKELFRNQLHPYTKALLSAIPRPKIHQKTERILLRGEITSPINPGDKCRFCSRCIYAQEQCFTSGPKLKEAGNGHYIACHYWKEIADGALKPLINDKDEGYYVLMTFTSGPEFPAELDRLMRINTGIMRSIIVCKD